LPEKLTLPTVRFVRSRSVHTHLDHILRMLIKTLAEVTVEVALNATETDGSAALRDRIKKLAKQRLGEGAALLGVQDMVERCSRVTERRNTLIHSTIVSDWCGAEAKLYRAGRPAASLTTALGAASFLRHCSIDLNVRICLSQTPVA
jgi:hypothetical protein